MPVVNTVIKFFRSTCLWGDEDPISIAKMQTWCINYYIKKQYNLLIYSGHNDQIWESFPNRHHSYIS